MVVRELERDLAMQAAKKKNDAIMLRALDCFNHGVCFLDTRTEKWQAMHFNSALAQARLVQRWHTNVNNRDYTIVNLTHRISCMSLPMTKCANCHDNVEICGSAGRYNTVSVRRGALPCHETTFESIMLLNAVRALGDAPRQSGVLVCRWVSSTGTR